MSTSRSDYESSLTSEPFVVILATIVPLLFFGPAVVAGALEALAWRWYTRDRDISRWWIAVLVALSFFPFWLASLFWDEPPLAVFLGTQLQMVFNGIAALRGEGSLFDGELTLGRYLGDVLPTWLPVSALAACAVGWFTRSRESPLKRREAAGIELPKRVEQQLARGIEHPAGGWALGYTPEGRLLAFSDAESRHHVAVCGATGTGKTTVLRHLIEGVAPRGPMVIVDCKASRTLRQVVQTIPGSVTWTIGGAVKWDALRGDQTTFASKLLAAEAYAPNAGVYRAAAQRYLQWVAQVLDAAGQPRDPWLIAELLSPKVLQRTIRQVLDAREKQGVPVPAELTRIAHLVADMGETEREGVAGFAARYGVTVEGAAGVSLGAGRGTLALDEAIRAGRTVLFSLDATAYPLEAAKVGAWALIDLVRVAGQLQEEGWGIGHQAYFVIDEFGALDYEGRHVVPVLARAREAGIACVVATQGLADLARIDRALPQQVVQNVAVRIMLRQGSHEDAAAWARHGGEYEREDLSRRLEDGARDTGIASTHWTREFYVSPDELRVLGVGEAVVWVAPIGRQKRRIERVRIAPPRAPLALPAPAPARRAA